MDTQTLDQTSSTILSKPKSIDGSFYSDNEITIRPYRKSDQSSAVTCLMKAFDDDPLMRKSIEIFSKFEWEEVAPEVFAWLLFMIHKSYDMTEVVVDNHTNEVLCIAIWEGPSVNLTMGFWSLGFLSKLLFKDYGLLKGYIQLMSLMESKRHKLAPSAHHLQALGAAVQGKGLGSKLIKYGIDRATKAGVPCYLESSNPKNISFYKRQGFEILEEIFPLENDKEKGPVATLMIRPYSIAKGTPSVEGA